MAGTPMGHTLRHAGPVAQPQSDAIILLVVALYAASFIAFGLLVETPSAIASGLVEIHTSRDTLLTDYIAIGGIGAAFVSTGLLTLLACLVYRLAGARMTGGAIACLFLVLGFGLFGKNLLNVWGIVLGVYLYARFRREPFSTHINIAFFGAALAPIFTEILFSSSLSLSQSLPLAVVTTVVLGFILAPAAAQLFKAHMGFTLYNMGFTAGLVGVLVVALYKSYGFVPDPIFRWSTGNNALLGSFLLALFVSMAGLGLCFDRGAFAGARCIAGEPGQSPSDFVALAGFGATLVNMGVCGTVGLAYILLIGGDVNGPVIGAILTIVGFAAFGKTPLNILPIMVGVFLGSVGKPWSIDDPSIQLAALFATTLAPIAGRFGWHWGVVAGFLHSSAALTVGPVHAGLNLYNNGFAAGIVASVLVPVILAIEGRSGQKPKTAAELGDGPPPSSRANDAAAGARSGIAPED